MSNVSDDMPMIRYQDRMLCNIQTGKMIHVSERGDRLLSALIDYYPNPVPLEKLYNAYDPNTKIDVDNNVKVYICKLRKMLAELGVRDAIRGFRCIGYKLNHQIPISHKNVILSGIHMKSLRRLLITHPDQEEANNLMFLVFGTA